MLAPRFVFRGIPGNGGLAHVFTFRANVITLPGGGQFINLKFPLATITTKKLWFIEWTIRIKHFVFFPSYDVFSDHFFISVKG
jgi:hypothetical protein